MAAAPTTTSATPMAAAMAVMTSSSVPKKNWTNASPPMATPVTHHRHR